MNSARIRPATVACRNHATARKARRPDAAQTAVETITPQAGIGHSREAATATMPSTGATQQRSAITRSTCHARLNRQRARAVANTSVAPHNAARWRRQNAAEQREPLGAPWVQGKVPKVHRRVVQNRAKDAVEERDQGRDDESGEELLEREPQRTVQRHSPAATPSDPEPGGRGCQKCDQRSRCRTK